MFTRSKVLAEFGTLSSVRQRQRGFDSESSDLENTLLFVENMDGGEGNVPPEEKFGDFFQEANDHLDAFAYAPDNVNIPPHYIGLITERSQFWGKSDEDPIAHLNLFYELTSNYKP